MYRRWFAAIPTLLFLMLSSADVEAIEYNVPEPEQHFAGKGWLIDSGSDHGIIFKTYLESKQLIVKEDGLYYRGTDRVEGIDGAPQGMIRWHYLTRCVVPPGMTTTVPIGLWISDTHEPNSGTDNFLEMDLHNPTPPNVLRGWYNLWWAVCRNELRTFN